VKWFLLKRNISKYAHCYHQFCAKLSVSTDWCPDCYFWLYCEIDHSDNELWFDSSSEVS
jgi:hypothetical protein